MMKVLFLDIDGVLNSHAYDVKQALAGGDLMAPDPKAVLRLLWILQETGAKVVLSSSWRLDQGAVEYLKAHGIPIHDVTPRGDAFGCRAAEIEAWLLEHLPDCNAEDIVILDDEPDAGVGFEPRFVQTDAKVGLTAEDATRVIGLFT